MLNPKKKNKEPIKGNELIPVQGLLNNTWVKPKTPKKQTNQLINASEFATPADRKKNGWKLRLKHGRDRIFDHPEEILKGAKRYFKEVDNNPWLRPEIIKSGDRAGQVVHIPTQRPYTLKGLSHFLGISFSTWQRYKERQEFTDAIVMIEEFIYDNQFEGAVVKAFDSNIIARNLGLVDKQDRTSDGEAINKGFYDFIKMANRKNDRIE